MIVHEGVKGFMCQICHQEFNAKVSLKIHIRRIHEKIKYDCEVCGKKFTDPKTVHSHQKKIHEGQKSCWGL